MVDISPTVEGTIDILIDYKKGGLTLAQAVDRFSKLTGIDQSISEKYIRELGRDNIISLTLFLIYIFDFIYFFLFSCKLYI